MTTFSCNVLAPQAALLAVALLWQAPAHADIYKWVDANGKTHYSDRKEVAGNARVNALKHDAAPSAQAQGATPAWKEREREYKLRQQRANLETPAPDARPRRQSHSYGTNQIDTDKAKCELARDVLSGAMGHVNGAVTDANDLQTARRDIGQFCR